MRFDQLDQWLSWFQTFEIKRSPADALSDVEKVAKRLNLLSSPYRVITVAGTNGKSSCVALLESIYSKAGYRVGTFTSPHLLQFNERIYMNGSVVSDEPICDAFDKIDSYCSTKKQFLILKLIIDFHKNAEKAIENGATIDELIALPVKAKIVRARYIEENNLPAFSKIEKEILAKYI